MTRLRTLAVAAAFVSLAIAPSIGRAAGLAFASTFSDHMVLQRDQPLRVWGSAERGTKVSVTVAGKSADATADGNGKWTATLPALPAGGPVELVVTGGDQTATLTDVLIGDVWLCSGQSNMQFPLKDAKNAAEAIAAAVADNRLRLLTVPSNPAAAPLEKIDATWTPPTEKEAAEFSAVGIEFALSLRHSSPPLRDVPIGLIDSSLGGSHVEYWIPAEPGTPPTTQPASIWNVKPAQLYNALIAPLAGTNLKGVLWYQGESNTGRPTEYAALLRKMIAAWREDFQAKELPFYIVQLPNFSDSIDKYSYAWLREGQAEVAKADEHVKLAITLDTPDGYDLHPKYKQLVAGRLALLARRYSYGEDVVADSPSFKASAVKDDTMRVTFDTHGSSLRATLESLNDFELAAADGLFFHADAKLDGDDAVVLRSDRVKAPAFARYAWQATPHATLINAEGLPAAPFRTDTIAPSPMMELQEAPPPRRIIAERYTATLETSGWMSGLLIDGHQFINPDRQGGLLPLSGFGPYPLGKCTPISATQIAFNDGDLTLTYRFEPDIVHVDISNAAHDGKSTVRMMLAPNVTRDDTSFVIGSSKVTIDGIDRCERSNDGHYDLQSEIAGGTMKTISLRLLKRD